MKPRESLVETIAKVLVVSVRLLEATIVLIAHRLWTIAQVMVVSMRLLEATLEPID